MWPFVHATEPAVRQRVQREMLALGMAMDSLRVEP